MAHPIEHLEMHGVSLGPLFSNLSLLTSCQELITKWIGGRIGSAVCEVDDLVSQDFAVSCDDIERA